jgi:hypothetical protein
MKFNFSKISYVSYQEDECCDLSVQTWKFLYIWVCILLQTSVSWSYRFYFSTFNEITRAIRTITFSFFHLIQYTDAVSCSRQL